MGLPSGARARLGVKPGVASGVSVDCPDEHPRAVKRQRRHDQRGERSLMVRAVRLAVICPAIRRETRLTAYVLGMEGDSCDGPGKAVMLT